MKKLTNYECLKELAAMQKNITYGARYITANYELAVLAVIVAFKRIRYRNMYFPIMLSSYSNAKQIDGTIYCPEDKALTTFVQVKCISDRRKPSPLPSYCKKMGDYVSSHYGYYSMMNERNESDYNYVLVNFDSSSKVKKMTERELESFTYNFFSSPYGVSYDNHIMRVEKMLQHIEHYKDDESFKPTYRWLYNMLNYIYHYSVVEHGCAVDQVLNNALYRISSVKKHNEELEKLAHK